MAITSLAASPEKKVSENWKMLESAGYLTNGLVDTDKLYTDIKHVFDKEGKIIEHLPYFEDVTFTIDDLEKLKTLIGA